MTTSVYDDFKIREILQVHANKLVHEKLDWHAPCAYLLHANQSRDVPLDASFIKFTQEELIQALNTELRSVQWLMQQVTQGADHASDFVAGVLLPDGNVVSHVFPKKVKRSSASRRKLLQ